MKVTVPVPPTPKLSSMTESPPYDVDTLVLTKTYYRYRSPVFLPDTRFSRSAVVIWSPTLGSPVVFTWTSRH